MKPSEWMGFGFCSPITGLSRAGQRGPFFDGAAQRRVRHRLGVVKLSDVGRALRYQHKKTWTLVEVELVGDFAQVVDAHLAQPIVRPTIVNTTEGKPYTVSGSRAMFRR